MKHYVFDTNAIIKFRGIPSLQDQDSELIIPEPVLTELRRGAAQKPGLNGPLGQVWASIRDGRVTELRVPDIPLSEITRTVRDAPKLSINDILIVFAVNSYALAIKGPNDKVIFVTDDVFLSRFAHEKYGLCVITTEVLSDLLRSQDSKATMKPIADLPWEIGRISRLEAEVISLKEVISNIDAQVSNLHIIYRPPFVDENRLQELRGIKSSSFDLSRLIRLCEELNKCYAGENFLATAMLVRGILDHVPPVFGCKSFTEVANNYAGSKSFKQCMGHLENTSRKIADAYLHEQIRISETLPNETQVNFSSDLDVLLAEIVRRLRSLQARPSD
jgi:predicted nucleic acid-binding protein